ncbi:hypothetical protein R0I52_06850 [Psychrobacter sp. CAM01]|uniref:hypothetical protein n=1 Tax=Psychrobacter sp. CAM01 TaxID=3080335 RepID=UPI0029361EA3|nr:hypothetical protein [Psychrobacter sp. CAM01]MDV2860425.1 hypothetical protein [Psychrobacter sp. CAM01]
MTGRMSFSNFIIAVLAGSMLTSVVVGCQPKSDTPDAESAASNHTIIEHPHDEYVHTEYSHAEHNHSELSHNEHSNGGHAHTDHNHTEHSHDAHTHATASTAFTCEPATTIKAFYHYDATPQTAHLLIDGIEYDLTASTESNDQQIYMSDIGLDDRHGIIWQVSGDEATLLSKTLDDEVAVSDEQILFNCHTA